MAKIVRFHLDEQQQWLVTGWISGHQISMNISSDFNKFMATVRRSFGIEHPRVYALQSPDYAWMGRIRLTVNNFSDFMKETGLFADKLSKLYVCADESPTGSPGQSPDERTGGDESSQASHRSGQTEFSASIVDRDDNKCVFCECSTGLEGAHILTYKNKKLLRKRENQELYGLGTINDCINGIALCWDCHKCFDANLLCIHPTEHTLCISDALLANESDKFAPLVGRAVKAKFLQWPNEALLGLRKQAMDDATKNRHDKQEQYDLFCKNCSKGYKRLSNLRNHEESCDTLLPSMYHTPASKL